MNMLDRIKAPYEEIKAHALQQQEIAERAIKTGEPQFFGVWQPTGERVYLIKEPEIVDETRFIRFEVMQFAGLMEVKLRENEDKDHWSGESQEYLFNRLLEEVAELFGEMPEGELVPECVDVANFAMMMADNHGGNAWKS